MARKYRFTPYRPPAPPAGSYDPALDAQEAAARRGLTDLQSQIGTQQARDVTDYGVALQGLGQQEGDLRYQEEAGRHNLQRQYFRGMTDLTTQRNRAAEDYQRNVGLLTRKYGIMGRNQLQGANVAGVLRGGAMLQSAAKRSANQAIERQPLDTNYQRFQADANQQVQRMGEDLNQSYQGLTHGIEGARRDLTLRQGQLALDYSPPDANNPLGGRRWQDRTTQLTQAQREQAFFGQDVAAQRAFQAAGQGWDPEQRPANEFVSKGGTPYRVYGGFRYDQRGRRLGRATGRGF